MQNLYQMIVSEDEVSVYAENVRILAAVVRNDDVFSSVAEDVYKFASRAGNNEDGSAMAEYVLILSQLHDMMMSLRSPYRRQ